MAFAAWSRAQIREALAQLAHRYVATRAPVTAKDLAGWASLTLGQARRGLAAIESDCTVTDLDGMTTWSPAGPPPTPPTRKAPVVDLVQGYDELIMSYFESRRLLAPAGVLPVPDWTSYLHAILIGGQLAGHWRHQIGKNSAVVEVQLRHPLKATERTELDAAVGRYGDYLGVPTTLAEPELLA